MTKASTTAAGERVLVRAEFDPRLPTYWLLVSTIGFAATIIGIPFAILWVLGIGQHIHRRQYEALEAELTERTLNIRRGFLFRTQKNVPLDKITDLAVNEGPILRHLGLCSLNVETAGGGANTNMGQAQLPGVVEAVAFRDAVLAQRDRVTDRGAPASASAPVAPVQAAIGSTTEQAGTLAEIRDSLARIEGLLEKRFDERS